jgi:hypothetical protein
MNSNSISSFDKLRTSGPFVVSLSNHVKSRLA